MKSPALSRALLRGPRDLRGGSSSGLARPASPGPTSQRAAVLLEVILALTLFVFAASIISTSLQTAVDRTQRLHAQAHSLDLAASVLAEIEIGIRPAQSAGPDHFEAPFAAWTWQIEASPYTFGGTDSAALQLVNVIVRQDSASAVQRLSRIIEDATRSTITNAIPENPLAAQGPTPSLFP